MLDESSDQGKAIWKNFLLAFKLKDRSGKCYFCPCKWGSLLSVVLKYHRLSVCILCWQKLHYPHLASHLSFPDVMTPKSDKWGNRNLLLREILRESFSAPHSGGEKNLALWSDALHWLKQNCEGSCNSITLQLTPVLFFLSCLLLFQGSHVFSLNHLSFPIILPLVESTGFQNIHMSSILLLFLKESSQRSLRAFEDTPTNSKPDCVGLLNLVIGRTTKAFQEVWGHHAMWRIEVGPSHARFVLLPVDLFSWPQAQYFWSPLFPKDKYGVTLLFLSREDSQC